MDHTHIVQVGDLERYADTRDSQSVIPELIYRLVKQSIDNPIMCRIPYGDAVNQPGWDGLVETDESFLEFVPEGKSYWEIGTGSQPQDKATDDFKKRTDSISDTDRAKASFVFVTPRCAGSGGWNEPAQTRWLNSRKDSGWKLIRIIDGVKLADWLREFPVIGQWMAKKVNLSGSLGGLSTPREHWEIILEQTASGDPPLPPELFTQGRSNVCNALQALFEGQSNKLFLFAESPQDVADFVAAYIETLDAETASYYANRCLYINEEDAWRAIVEVRKSHVLVAGPRLGLDTEEQSDLQTIATRKGHAVIIPLCGAWSGESPEIIKLRSPSQSQIEAVLKEAGYSDVRSRELSRIGGDRISALRRHLHGLGTLPPYGTWKNARLIAQAGLAGKWNGKSTADRDALGKLLGKEYGEWIETLRSDAIRSDAPLIQRDEKWRFVARSEAWSALGNRITDDDLDLLQEVAITVLGERDPKFDLPKEERFTASLHGKQLVHSRLLREGLAETLALVGSQPEALSSCSFSKAEATAVLTVRRLLSNANWERWASLDSLLILLAEAAPDEFLDAVESVLVDLDQSPFLQLFAQEGSGGVGGWNYMSGLLWALETLAWHPDFLSRVAVILSDIASIDPGGNWANRPSNSLVDIFLPWHVQTCASLKKRKAAIEIILYEQPEVGWKFLLDLLPHSHGFTSGCHRPIWRNYIPRDWEDGVLKSEYFEQITIYTELAVGLAKTSTEKLRELIDRLHDLPQLAQENLLEHLSSEEIVSLPEAERLIIWEKLMGLVCKHRKFADAKWAMPEEMVSKIEGVANILAPTAPKLKYQHLFINRDLDLFEEKGSYEEQRKRLDEARQDAIQTILDKEGMPAVLTFAQKVAAPGEVGRALGNIGTEQIEREILPALLDNEDETEKRVISGFIWGRFWKLSWHWVDKLLENDWNVTQKSSFFVMLPFEEGVWSRVTDQLGRDNERLYWQNANVNPYGPDRDLSLAIEKLIEYGRPNAAILCVSRTVKEKGRFNEELAIKALLSVLEAPDTGDRLDKHCIIEVINCLQKSSDLYSDALFKIEWNFLPWLDRFSYGTPVTLEKRLASDPSFFAEVISIIFRSKNEGERKIEPSERRKSLAQNAYSLLTEWSTCPGRLSGGVFDADAFTDWLNEVKRITKDTGHGEVAQIQVGHVLTHAPMDPDGLWIHHAVAAALNARDAGEMRSGFTTVLFNQRGVYGFTNGEEELELSKENRKKAEALEEKGYSRFATAMREFAKSYERQAKRESKISPFED